MTEQLVEHTNGAGLDLSHSAGDVIKVVRFD
jgi:hypothetical protein